MSFDSLTEISMSLDLNGLLTIINKTDYSVRIHFHTPENKKTSLIVRPNDVRKFDSKHKYITFNFKRLIRGSKIKVPLDAIEPIFSDNEIEQKELKFAYVNWKKEKYDEKYLDEIEQKIESETLDEKILLEEKEQNITKTRDWVKVVSGESWGDQMSDEEKEKNDVDNKIDDKKIINKMKKIIFELEDLIDEIEIEFQYKIIYKGKEIMNSVD